MGEEGLEEMLEQVICKKIWAGRYRCRWHPDVIWYVPADQMPSSGMRSRSACEARSFKRFYFNAEALTKHCCLGSLGNPDLCVVAPHDDGKTVTGKHKVILANLGGSLFLNTTRYLSEDLFVSSVSVSLPLPRCFPVEHLEIDPSFREFSLFFS
jgi:hypothetical protein